MAQNVFRIKSYTWRYYLRHPLKYLKMFGKKCKWAYQRVVRGWCDYDTYSMDNWFCDVVPDMLDYLAANHMGWPDMDFETLEDWEEWLEKTAAAIRYNCEENYQKDNEFAAEYNKAMDSWHSVGYTVGCEEIRKKFTRREKELAVKAQADFETAISSFAKYFHDLWD